jgi:hypothetical protein
MTIAGSEPNNGEASPGEGSRMAAADQPVSTAPHGGTAPAPFAPLAALLLVVGMLLGSLRLVARRVV